MLFLFIFMIEVNDVTFSYGDAPPVLENLSLKFREHEFTVILGPNGCGKTTLGLLLNGMLKPSSGAVLIDGFSASEPEHIWEVRRRVGMVFQDPSRQMVATSVEDEIAFGPENLAVPPDEIRQRIDYLSESLGFKSLLKKDPHYLSGGQKQRVAIASVLALNPSYIVMDEPTSMLDPGGRAEVAGVVGKLRSETNISVIYITHHIEEALRADRAVVLNNGKVIFDDDPLRLFDEDMPSSNLAMPPLTELIFRLRDAGFAIPPGVYTPYSLAEVLRPELKQR